MATGRQPLLRGTGQSDADMMGFNILNVNAVGNVQQATIHVDPLMTDDTIGARGTGAPFRTIEAAIAAAEPGDTVILRPGTHAFDGTLDIVQLAGLTILGYGAIITSESAVNETIKFRISSGSVTFEGMEFDGQVTDTPTLTGDGCIDVTSPGFTIRNCFIHSQNGYGIHLSESFDGARIFDCDIELCLYGIFGESETTTISDTDGIWIKRCNIESNRGAGVALSGPGPDSGFFLTRVQISDCQFTRNDRDGDGIPAVVLTFACQGVEVNDNHIKDESGGIYLDKVRNASISGNHLKGITVNAIQLTGCIAVKVNDNIIDGRNSAGNPATTAPILISGQFAAPNDAARFVITGNELVGLKTNSVSISASNATGVMINSNRIEGTISLISITSAMVNDNQFVIPQTTQAILINAGDSGSSKITISCNRFNFTGASISRCICTVDASATTIDDVLIHGNATPTGQVFGIATYGHSGSNLPTRVVQLDNVPESSSVTTGWANTGASNGINQVFVSQAYGSDTVGVRQSRTARFKTINAAITAAVSGDDVVVEDGTFNERLTAKNGIAVRFMSQALLRPSTASGCIVSSANNQIFSVYHEHAPMICTQNTTDAVSWTHSGAVLNLHASIAHTGSGVCRTLYASNGTIEIWASVSSQSDSAIEVDGGTIILHGGTRTSTSPDASGGGNVAGVEVQSGTFKADNAKISGGANGVFIDCNTGNATFKQCTVVARGTSSAAVLITSGSNVPLFRDCVLVSDGASATETINVSTAQTIKLYGQTVGNEGTDPPTNVTFNGGGSYDVNAAVTED